MYGTINYIWFYIFIGIVIVLGIVMLIIFAKGNYYHDKEILSLTIIPALLLMVCLAIEPFLANYNMSNQSENNIRTAIRDNYNNAENIAIKSNSGYFSSDNENYSFEVIDDTLIIKNGEIVTKYISGDNY